MTPEEVTYMLKKVWVGYNHLCFYRWVVGCCCMLVHGRHAQLYSRVVVIRSSCGVATCL